MSSRYRSSELTKIDTTKVLNYINSLEQCSQNKNVIFVTGNTVSNLNPQGHANETFIPFFLPEKK